MDEISKVEISKVEKVAVRGLATVSGMSLVFWLLNQGPLSVSDYGQTWEAVETHDYTVVDGNVVYGKPHPVFLPYNITVVEYLYHEPILVKQILMPEEINVYRY